MVKVSNEITRQRECDQYSNENGAKARHVFLTKWFRKGQKSRIIMSHIILKGISVITVHFLLVDGVSLYKYRTAIQELFNFSDNPTK